MSWYTGALGNYTGAVPRLKGTCGVTSWVCWTLHSLVCLLNKALARTSKFRSFRNVSKRVIWFIVKLLRAGHSGTKEGCLCSGN